MRRHNFLVIAFLTEKQTETGVNIKITDGRSQYCSISHVNMEKKKTDAKKGLSILIHSSHNYFLSTSNIPNTVKHKTKVLP